MQAEAQAPEADSGDDDAVLDHIAMECMEAITARDTEKFKASFQVLVGDVLRKLSDEMEMKEPSEGEES
jgi:hypothetical protein